MKIANKFLIKEEKSIFYLYRQTTNYGIFTGIIGGASVKDYQENKIKKHENIIDKRKEYSKYLDSCGFHVNQYLVNQPSSKINKIILSDI